MSEDGMTVTLEGGEKLIRALRRMDNNVRGPAAKAMVEEGGQIIAFHARQNIHRTFSKHQTGGLTNAIRVESESKGKGAVAHVRPYRIYARIQELGGTIVPVRGQFLVWRDPDTGALIKARKVTLPQRPYLKPAAVEHQSEIVSAMAAEAQEYLK